MLLLPICSGPGKHRVWGLRPKRSKQCSVCGLANSLRICPRAFSTAVAAPPLCGSRAATARCRGRARRAMRLQSPPAKAFKLRSEENCLVRTSLPAATCEMRPEKKRDSWNISSGHNLRPAGGRKIKPMITVGAVCAGLQFSLLTTL